MLTRRIAHALDVRTTPADGNHAADDAEQHRDDDEDGAAPQGLRCNPIMQFLACRGQGEGKNYTTIFIELERDVDV